MYSVLNTPEQSIREIGTTVTVDTNLFPSAGGDVSTAEVM